MENIPEITGFRFFLQKNFPYGVDWEKLYGVADGLLADTSLVSNIYTQNRLVFGLNQGLTFESVLGNQPQTILRWAYSILKSLLRTTLVQNKKLHSLYPISTARVIPVAMVEPPDMV